MDFFVPHLTLLAEPDGEFTLHAVTLVPNHGFAVAGVRPGAVPANVRILPESFPILLMLRQLGVDTFSPPALRTHVAPNLVLKAKKSLLAFVCLEGNPIEQTLGTANISVVALAPTPKPSGIVSAGDWTCWVETGAHGRVLHVTGVVFTSTPALSVSLQLKNPQGINPHELLLDLIVKGLPGNASAVVVPHVVKFQSAYHDYRGVTVFEPNGNGTRIPINDGSEQ